MPKSKQLEGPDLAGALERALDAWTASWMPVVGFWGTTCRCEASVLHELEVVAPFGSNVDEFMFPDVRDPACEDEFEFPAVSMSEPRRRSEEIQWELGELEKQASKLRQTIFRGVSTPAASRTSDDASQIVQHYQAELEEVEQRISCLRGLTRV